ncbi:MAG TPA: 16S rRNA (guanine(966)-N(2))-methyltransferase RsmD [Burkholderiales bacterium]|nr:16S rRNA (guanine(966)-N(2))-methyltransferase RsmD [Burkholderiales bacterium]
MPISTSNRIRIIGGRWRSRIIEFPPAEGLRPTPDRVRETLFNWLDQDLSGKRCLDLFAGAGGLGFEALSRNAMKLCMVEKAAVVYRSLQRNAEKLDAGQHLRLLRADALEFLRADHEQYDIVFVDPPYGSELLKQVWPLLPARLAAGALVYAENDRAIAAQPGWQVLKSGRAGGVYFYLFQYAADEQYE